MPHDNTLPPAGHARQEALKARADKLEMMAEQLEKKVELHGIDPDKFKPENEIVSHLDMRTFEFHFDGALPEYHYFWCYRNRKEQIDEAKSRAVYWYNTRRMQAPVRGYEMVRSGMPEWDANKDLQHAEGGIVIGDLVLMRIKREVKEVIDANIEYFKRARTSGILNTAGMLEELADRSGGRVSAHTFQDQSPQQFFANRGRRLVHTGSH